MAPQPLMSSPSTRQQPSTASSSSPNPLIPWPSMVHPAPAAALLPIDESTNMDEHEAELQPYSPLTSQHAQSRLKAVSRPRGVSVPGHQPLVEPSQKTTRFNALVGQTSLDASSSNETPANTSLSQQQSLPITGLATPARTSVVASLFTRVKLALPSSSSSPPAKEPQDRVTAPYGSNESQTSHLARMFGQARRPRLASLPGHEPENERTSSNNSGSLNQPNSPTSTAGGTSNIKLMLGNNSSRIAPLPPSATTDASSLFTRRSQSDTPQMQGGGIMVRPPPSPLGKATRGKRSIDEK